MPWTDHPDVDAEIDRIIEDRIVSVDRAVTKLGYPGLSKEEVSRIAAFAVQQTRQAIQRQRQGKASPTQGLPPGMTMADVAEGGFINDRAGQATAALRQQLGIPEPMLRRRP